MVTTSHGISPATLEGWATYTLTSRDGRCVATLIPDLAMLCASLTLDGEEYLGLPNSVGAFARRWATTGIPLLHPWANRLGSDRLVGTDAPTVSTASRLVPTDDHGLAIHGLNLAGARWTTGEWAPDDGSVGLRASMVFDDRERLTIFPFAHELTIATTLRDRTLRIATAVANLGADPMPVSFGWHPYFRLPGVPRSDWRVSLPVTRHAELDDRNLPTGREHAVTIPAGPLGDRAYDDLFPGLSAHPVFVLSGGDRELRVAFGDGYPIAQVYAPATADVIAFEPMTAPTNALVTGAGLRWIGPRERFAATFAVNVRRDTD